MIPQKLDEKISGAGPFLVLLKKRVADTIGAFADSRNFPFTGRIKSAESIAEKIEMGRFRRFSELDDLVAFTLIIPSVAYEKEVVAFCRETFDVALVRNKATTQKPPDVFRFDSTRIVARERRPSGISGPSIYDYQFEIQVRTAFEHAWSVANHGLVYKTSTIEWKRVRLAAQLKATSEGLDAAIASFDHLANGIEESPWNRMRDQIEISKFVVDALQGGRLPNTLHPASVSRFSENFCSLVRAMQPTLPVHDALQLIDSQLKQSGPLPVSLSLYQLFLGIICDHHKVSRISDVYCHVTGELAALFPETAKLDRTFDYES